MSTFCTCSRYPQIMPQFGFLYNRVLLMCVGCIHLYTGWTAYLLGEGFSHDAVEDDRGHHLSILHVPGRPRIHRQAPTNVHLAHDQRLTC